jgi:hypothetical protein
VDSREAEDPLEVDSWEEEEDCQHPFLFHQHQ